MMSIFKPENAAQSSEREAEIERERAEHDGTSESGAFENSASENRYGYGYDGEHTDREEGAAESESEFAAAEEPRATTLSTAEPAATIGHDRADRDEETLGADETGSDEIRSHEAGSDALGSDEELTADSMSGEAVQMQPQTTPMQPASVPETTSATPSAQSPLATDPGPVLAPEASLDFRERWHGIQAEFIDDPRRAVEDADRLVADVARAFATGVEERRRGLTSGWQNDEHGETEELRLTMRQYRALVDHILHD